MGGHGPIPVQCTSHPTHPYPPKWQVKVGKYYQMSFWLFCFYWTNETYAAKIGWRTKFQDLGHPFSKEGMKGGKLGSWPARMGWVKNAGGEEY